MRCIPFLVLALAKGCAATSAQAGDAVHGASLFEDRCAICHVPAGGGQGPSLRRVVGRKAASVSKVSYSPALRASHLVWTAANLDRFLTDPGKMVPGTAMPIRLPNPAQRADLITYLATLK